MNCLFPSITASLTGTLILFFIFFYLYRSYREKFLLLWSAAWLIYSFRFFFEFTGIVHSSDLSIALSNIITIISGVLLLQGTLCLARQPFSKAWTLFALSGMAWIIISKVTETSFFIMSVPVYSVLAAIYIFTGITVIKSIKGTNSSILIAGLAFILLGIHKAGYPFFKDIEWFSPWGFYLSTLFEFISALAMLLVFFEIQQAKQKKAGDAYISILNATSEAIFIHDANTGMIIDINDTATTMFGYQKEEIIFRDPKSFSDEVQQFHLKEVWEKITRTLKENKHTFEWLCQSKEGRNFWVEVSLKKFMAEGTDAVLSVVRDISERKAADKAFEHSRSSLRQIFEEGLLVFLMLDKNGKMTFANNNFSRMTGWEIDEINKCDLFENFFHNQDDAKKHFMNTVSDNGVYDAAIHENKIKTRAGKDRIIRWNCAPSYDAQARCDGAVIIAEDITEHRIAEEEKEFRNTLLTTEMETTIDGILIVDSNAKMILSNKRFSEIWEIPEEIMNSGSDEAAIGHVMSKLENPEEFIERIKHLYTNPEEKSRDEIKLIDGRILDRYSASMIGTTGKYHGRAWYFRDVTDQKRTENALREREEQLIGLAANLPGVIYQFYARQNGEMGLYFVNNKSKEIFGIDESPIETYFQRFTKNVEDGYREGFLSSVTTAVRTKQKWDFEGKFTRPEGGSLWFRGISVPIEKNEEIVFNGLLLDITDKKQAEDALRESEEKFREVFENMTEAMALYEIIYNENGEAEDYRIINANPAYTRHTGIDYKKVLGKTGKEIHRTDTPPYFKEFETVARTRVPYTFETFFPPLKKTFSISVISPKAGRFATLFEDISGRKKAEANRLEMERKMLHIQKLESLGILAGGIAHDFNNILTSILGHADIALIKLPQISPARDSLAEIERAAQRASDLCRQMLAYSGRGKFMIKSLSLGDLVMEMAPLLKASISKKALLTLDSEKNLPALKGDAAQIRQIIMNLITNASDAIGEKNGEIKISTGSLYCSGDFLIEISLGEKLSEGLYVFLKVSDTGCGMDTETVNRIFEPFFTTKFTGRGLGMAAVLGIVKGHNGGIEIKSSVGEGSSLRIFFPASGTSVEKTVSENKTIPNKNIAGFALIVDDEDTVLSVAVEMLEMIGIEAIAATDGIEAIKKFKEHLEKIDFVLLDLTMPGLSGEETFHELRKIKPDAKIIISSGYSGPEISEKLSNSGLSGFIQKPFTIKALSEKINEIMQI